MAALGKRLNAVTFYRDKRGLGVPETLDKLLRRVIDTALYAETGRRDLSVCVTYTDDGGIQALNREHRAVDRPTDVLSFPMLDYDRGEPAFDEDDERDPENGRLYLGDIVLNVDRVDAQAGEYGHSVEREAAFLAVHSALHLLGYDHVDDEEGQALMEEKQKLVLEALGLTRDKAGEIHLNR